MVVNILINVILQTLILLAIVGIIRRRVRLTSRYGNPYFSSGKKIFTGIDAIIIWMEKLAVFIIMYYLAYLYNPGLTEYFILAVSFMLSSLLVFIIWKFNLFLS